MSAAVVSEKPGVVHAITDLRSESMRFARLTVLGALVGVLVACSTEGEEPEPPVEAATSAGDTSKASADDTGSTTTAGDSIPHVIESNLQAESLDALVRLAGDAGLDCSDASGDGEATTHTARLCGGNVLFTYFTDVDAMDAYAKGYVEKGNHVVLGDNWFVTGRPAVIDPLISTLQGG